MPLNIEKVKSSGNALLAGAVATPSPLPARPAPLPAIHVQPPGDAFADWVLGPAARVPRLPARTGLQAVLFDLDGVLVDTAECHFLAWKHLADDLGIAFTRSMNHAFRGVGRLDCLDKLLGEHGKFFAPEEKCLLADRKNAYYLDLVRTLSPKDLAPGAARLLAALKFTPGGGGAGGGGGVGGGGGIRTAIVSASKNARLILDLLAIAPLFDTIIDGNDTTRSKPDPQGFLLAAQRLRVLPDRCVILEDADAGIRAAQAAGMAVLGVGKGLAGAQFAVHSLADVTLELLERLLPPSIQPPSMP